MKNSLRIHKWTHNEFNIFILGVLTRPLTLTTETPINRAFQTESEGVRVKKEKKSFFILKGDKKTK